MNALVTGSTRGIGYAISQRLSENGYNVIRNGRTPNYDDPQYIKSDLSTLEGVETLVDTLLTKINSLDCLVLNAGITCRKSFNKIEHSDWQTVMDTNLNMPFFLVQKLHKNIKDNGSIIFISSILSLKPHSLSIPYGVSKAAVNALAQNLVKEFSPRNIRVNIICPGFIDTEWQKEKPEWLREKIENKVASKRFGLAEEVAEAAMFLTNNAYMNGSVLQIDGGYDFE